MTESCVEKFFDASKVLFIIILLLFVRTFHKPFFEYIRKSNYALHKNTVLPVIVGFADVPVISETIVDTGCDVVGGSADTVDELISTSTALDTFYTPPFVCAL